MKELKVGERAAITLEVVEQTDCEGCFFDTIDRCTVGDRFACSHANRSDDKDVVFKEVKE